MESVESQKQASPSFHSSLEISPKAVEISTFPQLRLRRDGKVEKQKTAFPLSHRVVLISQKQSAGGLRPPPAQGDLSTWPGWGSFYLALTPRSLSGLGNVTPSFRIVDSRVPGLSRVRRAGDLTE